MPNSESGLDEEEHTDGEREPRTYSSETLFGERREIAIAHGKRRYLLRITRQGKLILNKTRASDDERDDARADE